MAGPTAKYPINIGVFENLGDRDPSVASSQYLSYQVSPVVKDALAHPLSRRGLIVTVSQYILTGPFLEIEF